jgi:hypothetical protein
MRRGCGRLKLPTFSSHNPALITPHQSMAGGGQFNYSAVCQCLYAPQVASSLSQAYRQSVTSDDVSSAVLFSTLITTSDQTVY